MTESKPGAAGLPLDVAVSAVKRLHGLNVTFEEKRSVLVHDLIAQLEGRADDDWPRVRAALAKDESLSQLFDSLLSTRQAMVAPKLVAAQSDREVTERQGDRFSVRLRKSKANDAQVYVILAFDPVAPVSDGDSVSLVVRTESDWESTRFPTVHDGSTQIIAASDSNLSTLLRDPDSQISIIMNAK